MNWTLHTSRPASRLRSVEVEQASSEGEPNYLAVPNWQELGTGFQGTLLLDTTHGIHESFDNYPAVNPAMLDDGGGQWNLYGYRTVARGGGTQSLITGRTGVGKAFRFFHPQNAGQVSGHLTGPWGSLVGSVSPGLPNFTTSLKFVSQLWFRVTTNGNPPAWWKWNMLWYRNHGGFRTESGFLFGDWSFNHGLGAEDNFQPIGPHPSQVWDGNWHRFTTTFLGNTSYAWPSPSSRDGAWGIWVDGYKIHDVRQPTLTVAPTNGSGYPAEQSFWCQQATVDQIPPRSYLPFDYFQYPATMSSVPADMTFDCDDYRSWVIAA